MTLTNKEIGNQFSDTINASPLQEIASKIKVILEMPTNKTSSLLVQQLLNNFNQQQNYRCNAIINKLQTILDNTDPFKLGIDVALLKELYNNIQKEIGDVTTLKKINQVQLKMASEAVAIVTEIEETITKNPNIETDELHDSLQKLKDFINLLQKQEEALKKLHFIFDTKYQELLTNSLSLIELQKLPIINEQLKLENWLKIENSQQKILNTDLHVVN